MTSKQEKIRVSDSPFDFGQFYFSYAIYHYNDVNKWVHIFGIPSIAFSLLGMLHHTDGFGSFILADQPIRIDIGLLLFAVLLPIYTIVDFVTGLASTAFFIAQIILSNYLYSHNILGDTHMKVMIGLHIFGWVAQFVGHGIFEKRAPALLDNLLLIFVAPFFFIFEVLNIFLGYKEKEVKEWNKVVAREIKQFRENKSKKQ
ncbi:hypothetical protein FGO68_gene9971 [Halteria grandinella]|uniref:DUF962 domain-containing protein n=1 Tax=Halteria grandinella TaxID=5974 RepID=A0A8J8NIM4_HALGN|nr:hypothetical protein FGO68_gene9971 [Halteria grandinella]